MNNTNDGKNRYSIWSLLKQKNDQAMPMTEEEQDRSVRRTLIVASLLSLFILLEGFELLDTSQDALSGMHEGSYNPIWIFFHGLRTAPATIILLTLIAFLIGLGFARFKRASFGRKQVIVDEAGDKVVVNSSIGVRGILTDDEEGRIFDHCSLDEMPSGVPIAINNNTGELITKIPGLRTDFKYHLANDNVLVVGPSGAGKTSGLNNPAGATHIEMHHGCLIFDPKGDIYPTLAPLDIRNRRKVWLLDFKDNELSHSDGWDCLKQIRESDLDEAIQSADTFASIILENGDEQYWTDTIKNLFKMLLLYVTHGKTYTPPAVRQSSDDAYIKSDAGSRRTWRELMKLVTMRSDALRELFENVMLDDDDKDLLGDYFTTWVEDKNYSQIRSSLANALDVFKTPAVMDILSSDEIDIDALADGNASIYVACSGRNDTYMPVLTLFVNTVFQRTMSLAERNGGSLDHMLFVLLEEFYSLGRLGMLPRILSQSRSYNISTMISTQTMSQLEKYNTKDDRAGGRSSIQSACALQLCVGANEGVGSDVNGDTATYFSARAGKKERVDEQVTEDRFKPLPEDLQAPFQWDQKMRTTNKAELVYPPDRIQALTPDEIFISPGPNRCRIQKKYQWSLHPLYGTFAIDRETGERARFLTTEHIPVRKGGKPMTLQEYEIHTPKSARRRPVSKRIDTRTEDDFLAPEEY